MTTNDHSNNYFYSTNCLICHRIDLHFVIKISDFGLSEDVYSKNYFRQGDGDNSIKLPVKWMAPESLNDGVFSEKTDVVCASDGQGCCSDVMETFRGSRKRFT